MGGGCTNIVFDATEFKDLYPEFAAVSDPRLQYCFDQAEQILSNCCSSPIQNLKKRKIMLYSLTAHIASLSGVLRPGGVPAPSGRVQSATEGSVSVTFGELGPATGSGPWFQQTNYGAMVWQMTAPFRTMRYVSCPTRIH